MAKKKKKAKVKNKPEISNQVITGIIAAGIILFIAYSYLNSLFYTGSNYQTVRFLLCVGISLLAAHCAFWYCMGPKKFKYEK